jgi:renalase
MPSTLLIGAGMAGLTAARKLTEHGHTVTILDKGRGVGGRLATRRIDQSRLDHGAQYFTAKSLHFQSLIEELLREGVARIWPLLDDINAPLHYIGVDGMSAIAKYMAQSLNVITGERIVRIEKIRLEENHGWRTVCESGNTFEANNLLITIPAPQTLTLLHDSNIGPDEVDVSAMQAIQYSPCIAVMAVLNKPSHIPSPGATRPTQSPIAWVADNHQKGVSPDQAAITIQAGMAFSKAHFEDDQMAVGRALLDQLTDLIPPADIITYQVHRWRYSLAEIRHPELFLKANTPAPLLFGGDGFGPGNVEGAFLSGWEMAEAVGSWQ